MAIEQQFVSFLIERIGVKLTDIKKQTEGETTQFIVDEAQLFLGQLSEALNTILACESHPMQENPTPVQNRGRRRSETA